MSFPEDRLGHVLLGSLAGYDLTVFARGSTLFDVCPLSAPKSRLADPVSTVSGAGLLCALAAHGLWGVFPVYWKQIDHADSLELACHRIVWSFVLLVVVMPVLLARGWWGGFRSLKRRLSEPKIWFWTAVSAAMIGTNWLAFLTAVNRGLVLEASLGYYINPLFNVVLGVLVLGERLGRVQWVAVAIAVAGVVVMAAGAGGLPWLSLAMAGSFGIYALVKKVASLPVLVGLLLEVTWLMVPASIYLGMCVAANSSALQTSSPGITALLLCAGIITVTPLAFFAAAVERVSLSLLGILQYLGPTIQFLVGWAVYHETIDDQRWLGFVLVWTAILVFMIGPRLARRISRRTSGEMSREISREISQRSVPPERAEES